MSRDIWIEIMKSFVSPLIVGAVVAWLTARLSAKYNRTAPTPSEKPLSAMQLFIRKMGSFIKRNWPQLTIPPLTYVWPMRSFLKDVTASPSDLRVYVMWVALDVLLLAIISAFWISLFVTQHFALAAARALKTPESDRS